MSRARISICVANYNGEELLAECLDSVLAQRVQADIEILVHDDASRDGSLALLQDLYPQARVITSENNVGFCTSNNRMADSASGDYLLLLNNDAVLLPGALQCLLDSAQSSDRPAILSLPQYDWTSGALVDRGCRLDLFHMPVPNLVPARHEVAYVIGACFFLPRGLWDSLGGFPDWFGSIAEDAYLCRAAQLRGAQVRVVEGSGYRHRQGASIGGNRVESGRLKTNYARRYLSERNRMAVLAICMPTALMWPWLALHVAALLAEGLLLTVLKRDLQPWRRIYWRCAMDAWRARRLWASARRELQESRTINLSEYLRSYTFSPRKLVLLWRHGMPEVD